MPATVPVRGSRVLVLLLTSIWVALIVCSSLCCVLLRCWGIPAWQELDLLEVDMMLKISVFSGRLIWLDSLMLCFFSMFKAIDKAKLHSLFLKIDEQTSYA